MSPSVTGPDAHLVVAADNRQLARALQIEDCLLRHQQRSAIDVDGGADSPVLAGAQNIAGIREYPGNAYGSGPHIHLAVREVHFALLGIGSPVRQYEFELHAGAGFEELFRSRIFAPALQVLLFADGEIHFDWIQRGDGRDHAAGRADQGSDLKLRDTGNPVDGRGESRESEINARRFDRGRGGLDGGRRSRDLCLVCFDLRFCRL